MERIASRGAVLFGCDLDRAALSDRVDAAPVCAATLDRLPFRSESFALVTSNMVFEHLDAPGMAVSELARVSRRGGRILVHTVNGRHYTAWAARLTPLWFHRFVVKRLEGRAPEDVYPTRYRANTEARLRSLFESHGCRHVGGGLIRGIPPHVPVPLLFWVAIVLGMAERWLARLPGIGVILKPNLLMEFERR